jgi:uncharacterized protein
MELLHPGVYIQEVPSGVRPIEGVSTSTAAFLGKAQKGPVDRALFVASFIEFQRHYGVFLRDSFLAHAALHFFNNGGRRLYVARVAKRAPNSSAPEVKHVATADIAIADRRDTPARTITLAASSPGAWANGLELVIEDGSERPGDEFQLSVRTAGALAERFDNLSMNPDAANFVAKVVGAGSRLIAATVDTDNESRAAGVSRSGPNPANTLPEGKRALTINLHDDGPRTMTLAGSLTTEEGIAKAIEEAVTDLDPLRAPTPTDAYKKFTASFTGGVYELRSGQGGPRSSVVVGTAGAEDAATLLKLGTSNGGIEFTGAARLRPAKGTYLLGEGAIGGATVAITRGRDGDTPEDDDYVRTFALFDTLQDVNIVAVPGVASRNVVDQGGRYCQQRQDCFYIADALKEIDTAVEAREFVTTTLQFKTSYSAVYFPWLTMVDPEGGSETHLVPPSGFVAGIFARLDARRGVWKAPAGTEANVGGATGLAASITDPEQDILNPFGVNVLRFFPGSGIVIWGARTLATLSDPEYRYVPIRRFAIFLERSIYNGIQWAVFEPNDEDLWSSLRLNIGAFMMTLFRAGAFQGDSAAKAFFVKCDAETNPQDQIDAGIVTVLVGFAPLKPAEFVVIRISQRTAEAVG